MKKKFALTIFVIVGIFITLVSFGQKNPKRFYIENPKKKSIQLPFRLINNLVVIQVHVNNSDTLNFILDTGISNTLFLDAKTALALNMKFVREIKFCGFGGGIPLKAFHSVENEIRLGGIVGQHQDVVVVPESENDFDISRHLGIKIHGLIGYNLFRDLIAEINYENKFISFYPPRSYEYKKKKNSVTLPLTFEDTKPIITTSIIQDDSSKINLNLMIDTGASFALWLDQQTNSAIKLPRKTESLYLGVGLSGEIYGNVGRIREFGEGVLKLRNVITSYADTLYTPIEPPNSVRNGTIGADIISRFNLILDYRNNKITFRPNSRIMEPFQVNTSGMEICSPIPGENIYSIANICNNSPAQKAGLKVGDQIESINFEKVSKFSLPEVHSMLIRKSGKKMVIQYVREGKANTTVIQMDENI